MWVDVAGIVSPSDNQQVMVILTKHDYYTKYIIFFFLGGGGGGENKLVNFSIACRVTNQGCHSFCISKFPDFSMTFP